MDKTHKKRQELDDYIFELEEIHDEDVKEGINKAYKQVLDQIKKDKGDDAAKKYTKAEFMRDKKHTDLKTYKIYEQLQKSMAKKFGSDEKKLNHLDLEMLVKSMKGITKKTLKNWVYEGGLDLKKNMRNFYDKHLNTMKEDLAEHTTDHIKLEHLEDLAKGHKNYEGSNLFTYFNKNDFKNNIIKNEDIARKYLPQFIESSYRAFTGNPLPIKAYHSDPGLSSYLKEEYKPGGKKDIDPKGQYEPSQRRDA